MLHSYSSGIYIGKPLSPRFPAYLSGATLDINSNTPPVYNLSRGILTRYSLYHDVWYGCVQAVSVFSRWESCGLSVRCLHIASQFTNCYDYQLSNVRGLQKGKAKRREKNGDLSIGSAETRDWRGGGGGRWYKSVPESSNQGFERHAWRNMTLIPVPLGARMYEQKVDPS